MDPARDPALTDSSEKVLVSEKGHDLRTALSETFGAYRAEWLGARLYEQFTAPGYLPELLTARPCVLVGGRGTGKTTVLKGLSYEGQSAIHHPVSVAELPFIGLYYRVNTNRVTAFSGPELTEDRWTRVFSHYLNLTFVDLVLEFLLWFERKEGTALTLQSSFFSNFAAATQIEVVDTIAGLANAVRAGLIRFEAAINNVADGDLPKLSLLGQPLDLLLGAIRSVHPFKEKPFFFMIDEYESFSDLQQEICNTLVKHSAADYTFKIGVRDLGFRKKTTLSPQEQLLCPADYDRVDIAARFEDGRFADFARNICNNRLLLIEGEHRLDVGSLFPGLTEEEEAIELGIGAHVRQIRENLIDKVSSQELDDFDSLRPLEAYLVKYWADGQNEDLLATLRDALANPEAWRSRLANYQYSMLFTLRRGRRGLRKYYCGWDTFVSISGGNIRYLLHLIAASLILHVESGLSLRDPVDPKVQTQAAQSIGKQLLTELEGLAVDGAQLTRLVLGLGRIFQVLARDSEGHAPEVNQFALSDRSVVIDPASDDKSIDRIDDLIRSAVMHLALSRMSGNKLAGESGVTKEDQYCLHPMYAPFFEFSHRKKRKMSLLGADLLGLVDDPRRTIRGVFSRTHRELEPELSEQLLLFSRYYDAIS
jgi:hypothetical protein